MKVHFMSVLSFWFLWVIIHEFKIKFGLTIGSCFDRDSLKTLSEF